MVYEIIAGGRFVQIFIHQSRGNTMADDASALQKTQDAYDEVRALPGNNLPPIGTVFAQVASLTQANADLAAANVTLTTQNGTLAQEKQDLVEGNGALQQKMGLALDALNQMATEDAAEDAKRNEAIGHLS